VIIYNRISCLQSVAYSVDPTSGLLINRTIIGHRPLEWNITDDSVSASARGFEKGTKISAMARNEGDGLHLHVDGTRIFQKKVADHRF
jgi:hypothetical protein